MLCGKSQGGKAVGDQVHPKYLNGLEEQGLAGYHGHEHGQDLPQVAGQKVHYRFTYVGVDDPALVDGGDDALEVVVGQHHVRRFL